MLLASNLNIILAIIVSLKIPKLNGIKLSQWYNPISFIVIFHIVIHTLIGAILINNGFADNSVIHKVSTENIYKWSNYIALSVYIYYLTNFILIKFFFRKQDFNYWLNKRIEISNGIISNKKLFNYLVVTLVFCYAVSIYVTIVSGGIPHLRIFSMNLLEFRFSVSRAFPGIIYLKTVFFDFLPILLCCIFYSFSLTYNSLQTRWVFYFSFLLATYSTTFSFAKSPFVVFVLSLYIINILTTKKRGTNPILLLFLSSPVIAFYFFLSSESFDFISKAILNRIFIDEVSGSYLMFELYPNIYSHIGLNSISRWVEIFGLNYQNPAARVTMLYAFGERANTFLNLLSTYYLGEAYANFGILGIIISPIYVCIIITTFYHKIIQISKTPLVIGLFAYTILPSSISSQFNNFIYNPIAIVLAIILIIITILSRHDNYFQKHH